MNLKSMIQERRALKVRCLERLKLRALKEGVKARGLKGAGTRYKVPSSSDKGAFHIVTIIDAATGDLTCDCTAYETYGKVCVHRGAALLRLESEAETGTGPSHS